MYYYYLWALAPKLFFFCLRTHLCKITSRGHWLYEENPSLCQISAPPGAQAVWALLLQPGTEGRGRKTQMRAESLRRAVSQTLVETQELMNAARSQCMAQQLQLHSTDFLTEAALRRKIKGIWTRMAGKVVQMSRDLSLILQGNHFSTHIGRKTSPNSACSCVLWLNVCEWCNSPSTVGRNDSGQLRAHSH